MLRPSEIMHVGKIRTASIELPKWSVWATAGAAPHARTNDSNNDNMPTSPSSKQKRKDTVYEQILISDPATSFSNMLERSLTSRNSDDAWSNTMKRALNTSTLCPCPKANLSTLQRRETWAGSA